MQPVRIHVGPPRNEDDDGPFAMLDACHDRVARMLALLQKLRAHVQRQGVDEQARQAARDVMRYFDIASPEHHRDEELHVFPALLRSGSEPAIALARKLAQEHREMEAHWVPARRALAALAEDGRMFDADACAALDAFVVMYRAHIQAEDGGAYVYARMLLSPDALQEMQLDMQRRRGLH